MTRQNGRHLTEAVAANIRAARGERTQREVAQELGVPEVYISRWERGVNRPSDASMLRLADLFFGGDVTALYREPEEVA